MTKSKMKLYPFYEVADAAIEIMKRPGANVYQQFNCASCGVKQTMPDANVFYKEGICEECKAKTNIEKDGCNYMVTYGIGVPK